MARQAHQPHASSENPVNDMTWAIGAELAADHKETIHEGDLSIHVLKPSDHQAPRSAVYSSAASSHVKWPASTTSSLLRGSRSWRYSALTSGTTASRLPAMICTGVCIFGSISRST